MMKCFINTHFGKGQISLQAYCTGLCDQNRLVPRGFKFVVKTSFLFIFFFSPHSAFITPQCLTFFELSYSQNVKIRVIS